MFTDRVLLVKWSRLPARAIIAIALLLGIAAFAEPDTQTPHNISSWFSQTEIEALGLNQLSSKQQQALSDWITARVGATEKETRETLKNDSAFVKEASKTPDRIKSHIVGELNGWDGSTVFELQNGQIWRQRGTERSKKRLSNPPVIIEKNVFGFYVMKLTETGQRVKVRRIR